ncbi:hypothetical protein C001_00554, partial [Brucella sp. F5/06]
MNIHASNLDIEKFRKVYALVTGGATDGERVAAQARARKIAERAGISLNDAVSQLDSQPKPKPANFFEGFADWMEEKEPGYKAKRAREVVEREQRYASRRAEILKQFGTARACLHSTQPDHSACEMDEAHECGQCFLASQRNTTIAFQLVKKAFNLMAFLVQPPVDCWDTGTCWIGLDLSR